MQISGMNLLYKKTPLIKLIMFLNQFYELFGGGGCFYFFVFISPVKHIFHIISNIIPYQNLLTIVRMHSQKCHTLV